MPARRDPQLDEQRRFLASEEPRGGGDDGRHQLGRLDPDLRLPCSPELLEDERRSARAVAEVAGEGLRDDGPVGRQQELPRKRDAPRLAGILGDVGIQHAETLDHGAAFVGQERVADRVLRGEARERVAPVGCDRRDADTVRSYSLEAQIQLDQLISAVRSPVGRPREHH